MTCQYKPLCIFGIKHSNDNGSSITSDFLKPLRDITLNTYALSNGFRCMSSRYFGYLPRILEAQFIHGADLTPEEVRDIAKYIKVYNLYDGYNISDSCVRYVRSPKTMAAPISMRERLPDFFTGIDGMWPLSTLIGHYMTNIEYLAHKNVLFVEGNIGVGKSTFITNKMTNTADDTIFKYIIEPIKLWTQPMFDMYEDSDKSPFFLENNKFFHKGIHSRVPKKIGFLDRYYGMIKLYYELYDDLNSIILPSRKWQVENHNYGIPYLKVLCHLIQVTTNLVLSQLFFTVSWLENFTCQLKTSTVRINLVERSIYTNMEIFGATCIDRVRQLVDITSSFMSGHDDSHNVLDDARYDPQCIADIYKSMSKLIVIMRFKTKVDGDILKRVNLNSDNYRFLYIKSPRVYANGDTCDVDFLKDRIRTRGREGEQSITNEYLDMIELKHDQLFNSPQMKAKCTIISQTNLHTIDVETIQSLF